MKIQSLVSTLHNTVILGNSITAWALSVLLSIVVLCTLLFIKKNVGKRLLNLSEQTETLIDDMVVQLLLNTKFIALLIVSLWVGTFCVTLSEKSQQVLNWSATVAVFLQVAIWGNAVISHWLTQTIKTKGEQDPSRASALGVVGFFARFALWLIIALLLLDNLGFNISTLVAGLGVGSITIGLAVQNILGDVFCSISILLDKPFEVGDFIVIDNDAGVVEKIGIKSTRIKSLQGEQIVVSNANLLDTRIQNFKHMKERRIVFGIGVTYQTPSSKLQRIPAMIREIIDSKEQARFDRTHFKAFGDSALTFETVYYVLNRDYNLYMDTQQKINLELVNKFEKEQIEFAYPTQTLFIESNS